MGSLAVFQIDRSLRLRSLFTIMIALRRHDRHKIDGRSKFGGNVVGIRSIPLSGIAW
jgi:hypothetical protein